MLRATLPGATRLATLISALALASAIACSGVNDYPASNGGSPGSGGELNSNGGSDAAGGAPSASGGNTPAGGAAAGGALSASGGSAQGGSSAQAGAASGGRPANGGTPGGGGAVASGGRASGGAPGSGGALGSGGATTGVAFSQVQSIINTGCGSCHGNSGQKPNLASSGATLLSTLTSTSVSRCSGNKLVVASNTTSSALSSLIGAGCGSFKMPPTPLSAANVKTLNDWITQGAVGP